MNTTPIFRFAALVAVFAWTAAYAGPPQRIKLSYQVDSGSMRADVVETLEHDGRSYTIVSETRGKGILAAMGMKRTVRGKITSQELRPDEYRDERPFGWLATAKFDWESRSVTQERKGKSETSQMQGITQDPLSLAYAFAFAPPKGKTYEVIRADGRGLTPFRFEILGNEKLATPMGEMQTLHIAKVKDGPDDKATDIWFAADRDFLPVRVLVVDKDGSRVDQVVTRIDN